MLYSRWFSHSLDFPPLQIAYNLLIICQMLGHFLVHRLYLRIVEICVAGRVANFLKKKSIILILIAIVLVNDSEEPGHFHF